MRALGFGVFLGLLVARSAGADTPRTLAGELRLSHRISGVATDGLLVLRPSPDSRFEGLIGGGVAVTGGARGVEAGAGGRVFARWGPLEPHVGAELWWMPYQSWTSGWSQVEVGLRWSHAVVLQGTGGVRLRLGDGAYLDGCVGVGEVLNPDAGTLVDRTDDPQDPKATTVVSGSLAIGIAL